MSRRGVWSAPFRGEGGSQVAIAVDSQERLVATVTLFPGADRDLVRRTLEALLDAADPQRATLSIIR